MSGARKMALPEPGVMCDCGGDYYTADQVRAVERAAMEMAAQICDEIAEKRMRMDLSFTAAQKAAAAIRAEMSKEEGK